MRYIPGLFKYFNYMRIVWSVCISFLMYQWQSVDGHKLEKNLPAVHTTCTQAGIIIMIKGVQLSFAFSKPVVTIQRVYAPR